MHSYGYLIKKWDNKSCSSRIRGDELSNNATYYTNSRNNGMYGVSCKQFKNPDNTSAKPLDCTPSATAKPAPRSKTRLQGNFLQSFQLISFSPSRFMFGIMNSKTATITCIITLHRRTNFLCDELYI